MQKETLAQMAARLEEEMSSVESVKLFTVYVPRTIAYNNISDEIYSTADRAGVYVGDITWSAHDDTTAKVLVGIGKCSRIYHEHFNKWGKI